MESRLHSKLQLRTTRLMKGVRNTHRHDILRPPPDHTLSVSAGQLLMMVDLLGEIPQRDAPRRKERPQILRSAWYVEISSGSQLGNFANCEDVVPCGSSLKRVFEILKERSKYHIDMSPEERMDVVDLLHQMWRISPSERATAKDLLHHRWFHNLDSL